MPPTSQGHLAALVKAALDSMGINQAELARRMNMPESTVSTLIHRPKKQIPLDTVQRLAEVLPVHMADLLAAYAMDAGVKPKVFDIPDSPYRAVVTDAMGSMSEQAQRRLAQIAQDFRDDGK